MSLIRFVQEKSWFQFPSLISLCLAESFSFAKEIQGLPKLNFLVFEIVTVAAQIFSYFWFPVAF